MSGETFNNALERPQTAEEIASEAMEYAAWVEARAKAPLSQLGCTVFRLTGGNWTVDPNEQIQPTFTY